MAKKCEQVAFKTSIGGQALYEGIMMRGPKITATVVRTEEGLVKKEEPTVSAKDKCKIFGWPVIRGAANMIVSLSVGMKALSYSLSLMPEEIQEEEKTKFDKWIDGKLGKEKADSLLMSLSMFLGVLLAIGLFMLLPGFIAGLFGDVLGVGLLRNLVEGVLRIAIFLLYMWLVTKMKDIKRMWMYHGAEHKTIFCYEKGLELTVENCRIQPRQHPRCGTSFLFLVMIVSILVFSVVQVEHVLLRVLIKLLLLPVVMGISYEIIRYAGAHDNWFTAIMSAPGKALQNLTTQEPDDDMLEVAIEAMKTVIPEERGSDAY